jgi:hypothetical protein
LVLLLLETDPSEQEVTNAKSSPECSDRNDIDTTGMALCAMTREIAEKTIPQGEDRPRANEEQRTAPPAPHKGMITPPPVGDEGIYTKVPNPGARHEKEVIPPPGSPVGPSSRAK